MSELIKSVEEIAMMNPGELKPVSTGKHDVPEVKSVTMIEGVPVDQWMAETKAKMEADLRKTLQVDPKDELKFLQQENELAKARLENESWRRGQIPMRVKATYLAIGGAGALLMTIGAKCAGIHF